MRVTVAALVLALVVPSVARGVGVNDLAVTALRVPRSVRLTDTRPTRSGRGGVTIENRGTGVVLIPDAATLASLVTIAATASAGPVVCPALAPQVVVRPRQRFPVALVPGHHIQLPLAFPFVCASDPAGASTWDFTATVDRTVIDGMADEDPADDVCPRAPLGTVGAVVDRGCGALALHGRPTSTAVSDARSSARFSLAGPFAVGRTTLPLVDPSRPTMANGSYPGAPDRTLTTIVWYPAPGAGGTDAPLAPDGAPYPLVVFAHGLGAPPDQSTFLMNRLASHGFIVAAPRLPLSTFGAPGGQTIADKVGEAGDVSFVIDTMLALSGTVGDRFAGGVDAGSIGMSGHSSGGLLTLVATYDGVLRDARIRAALPFSPPSCFFQPGWYGSVDVPLLIAQGDNDLLVDFASNAENAFARANPPKALVLIAHGNHLGFSDAGQLVDDALGCAFLPPPATLLAQIGQLVTELGGDANHVSLTGCAATACAGDPTHILAARQRQIAMTAGLAFFESILRGDAGAAAFLADELAAENPDLTHTHVP